MTGQIRGALAAAAMALCAWAAGSGLRIEVLRGEGANNNPAARVPAVCAIRVLDAEGRPVPDVLVVFAAPAEGPTIRFAGLGGAAAALADETGAAIAPRYRAEGGNGPVDIDVTAFRGSEWAGARIHQMNVGLQVGAQDRIEVVRLPGGDDSVVRVRVEDASGRAVAGAGVTFLLRRRERDGRVRNLPGAASETSNNAGEAAAAMAGKPAPDLELVVTASLGGRRATRYYSPWR